MSFAKRFTIIQVCLLAQIFQVSQVDCWIFKIGNPINTNIQTGQVTVFTTPFTLGAISYFTISYPTAMTTPILQGAVGIVGMSYIIERKHGFTLFIMQVNQTSMDLQAWDNYAATSPSSNVYYMKVRYIVSCHPYLDIDYAEVPFTSSQNVTNPLTYDEGCVFIRCRKTTVNLMYGTPKATPLSITGTPFLSGFAMPNVPLDGEYAVPTSTNWNTTWTFDNYTTENYYGFGLGLGNFGTTSCQLFITVYGFTILSKVNVFYFTWESTLTNTYTTRVSSGTLAIGCVYDVGGCTIPTKIKVWSNTTIITANIGITTYFDNMYFFGLNHFIIYHDLNDADFLANPYTDPSIKMKFDMSSSMLRSGTDQYQTSLTFTGNTNNMFSFKFGYLIDIKFDCPATGNIYHISSTQCNVACPAGYYPSGVYCPKCSSRCQQCTGPDNNNCLSCYTSTQFRVLNGTTCNCQPLNYYDDLVSDICPRCSYTCLTCSSSSNSACTSCNITDNRYDDLNYSCPCIDGYYDGGGQTCVKCDVSCLTCTWGAGNNCITCPNTNSTFRVVSGNSCPCMTGYYSTGVLICSKCHYSCKTCSGSGTNCGSCQPTYFRSTLVSNTCPCNNGYYDDGTNGLCKLCYSTCKWCNGPTSNDCTQCYGSDNRALNSPTGQCLCKTGFYNFADICYACDYTCLNCTSNTATSCKACDPTKFRQLNSTTSACLCMDGYYSIAINPLCQTCDPTCQTCDTISTKCLTCRATDFRQLISNTCPCIPGYVDVAGVCTPCQYSCLTCSGVLATNCLTCNMTDRFPSGTSCLCRPGTYDNGNIEQCQPCHIQCVECTAGTNSSCTVCDASMKRQLTTPAPNFCVCTSHYFDSGPAACSTCFSQCQDCIYNSTYCLTCYTAQFRTLDANHRCSCLPHYYDTGADICLLCISQCYECSGLSTNCTSCPVLRVLTNGSCPCVSNYYEDPLTATCLQCSVLCKECVTVATQCTLCYTNMNRYLNNSKCDCSFGFYYDGVNPICLACPYYCQNCTTGPTCLDCSTTAHRFLSAGVCKCSPGYYDNGVSLTCLACSPICVECTDYAVCTVCNTAINRQLNLGTCQCFGKFYDAYTLATPTVPCQPCHYSCATCTSALSSNCTTCEANRNFTAHVCPCSDGYYESMQLCYLCDPLCKTCYGLPTNCTSCFGGAPVTAGTCLCFSGQYISGTTCYPCDPKCKECLGVATFCTDCYAAQLTTLVSNDCVCQSGTFRDTVTLACTLCESSCLECVGPTSLNCTSCNSSSPVNRVLSGSACICLANYYLAANNSCMLCNAACTACIGPSDFNCSACASGYNLIGSYCRQTVNCANYLYEGQCVNVCPKNSFPTAAHTCDRCTNGCLFCMSSTVCLECLPGYFYNASTFTCVALCQTGRYVAPSGLCEACMSDCLECQWNTAKNMLTCLRCATGFFLKDAQCSSLCPVPYYQALGSQCLKCIGNCLTCNSLSATDCVLCQTGMSFLAGGCYDQCPNGYTTYQPDPNVQATCQPCSPLCTSCSGGECLACVSQYYLSNGQCIQSGSFYDAINNEVKLCHPNCVSCTNTSFASCLVCRPNRGDTGELAISGYCECHANSIDMGNGVCDFQKFTELLQITDSLVSYSSSTAYLAALSSIVSTNFVGLLTLFGYTQTYSNLYFLNASLVMRVDHVLQQYRKTNLNSFFRLQTGQSSTRLLLEMQNDKSLFMRDQPNMYLIEWAMVPALAIVTCWGLTLCICCFINLCATKSNKISNDQNFDFFEQTNKKKKNQNIEQVSQVSNQDNYKRKHHSMTDYVQRFFSWYHESVAIVIHLVIATQIVLYGTASFKIMANETQPIQIMQFALSIALFAYIVGYTLRLFVGAAQFARARKAVAASSIGSKVVPRTSLKLLFHMHLPEKKSALNAVFLPALLLRNQLFSLLTVVLSFSPFAQLAGCGAVLLVFLVYSLLFCPYRPLMRVFLHLSDLAFLVQLAITFLVVSTQYGSVYSLAILQTDGSLYRFAWALLAINYLQVALYSLLSFSILIDLSKNMLCRKNKVEPQQQGKDIYQIEHQSKAKAMEESCESINAQQHEQIHPDHYQVHDVDTLEHIKDSFDQSAVVRKRYRIKQKKQLFPVVEDKPNKSRSSRTEAQPENRSFHDGQSQFNEQKQVYSQRND